MSRSSDGQGHTDICVWKGLDLSNNVCEYEVNRFTNKKVTLKLMMPDARPPAHPD